MQKPREGKDKDWFLPLGASKQWVCWRRKLWHSPAGFHHDPMTYIHLVCPRSIQVQGQKASEGEDDPLGLLLVGREPVLAGKESVAAFSLGRVWQPGLTGFP